MARGRVRGRLALIGPGLVAAVAYIDPGNFATNFTAGSKHGYLLVWVIVMANLMAVLVQYLSSKAGIATGRSLAELSREEFPKPVSRGLWVQAEIVAAATDLAEFVGAAIGLNLIFGVPLFAAGLITAVVAFVILGLEQRGYRRFELAIIALISIVALGFVYDLIVAGNQSASGFAGGLVPRLDGSDTLLLAVGIIGATVMPHVVYLHSALTQRRIVPADDGERRRLLRYNRVDCVLGLGLAGLINLVMLCIAAALFHGQGRTEVDTIQEVHSGLDRMVGGGAALAFAVALTASGLSSSSVGTYAGQVVMQGFIRRRIPLFLRRAITMVPALIVLALSVDTTQALVLSQVILSFGIPFALVPLIIFTRRRDVMGTMVNRRATTVAASAIAAVIICLNVYLIAEVFTG
ncbi:MAG: Nramp family divalent metal transporter [Thermoleophilia bacterium]